MLFQLFFVLSILGTFNYGYFFAFHLLHITQNNQLLKRVIMAVTRNGTSLCHLTHCVYPSPWEPLTKNLIRESLQDISRTLKSQEYFLPSISIIDKHFPWVNQTRAFGSLFGNVAPTLYKGSSERVSHAVLSPADTRHWRPLPKMNSF